MTTRRRLPGPRGVLLLALVAVAAGAVLVVVALKGQESAPRPHDAGRLPVTSSATPSATGGAAASPTRGPLGPSRPLRIRIPAIGVDSKVNPIGLDSGGALAVPQPGPRLNQAAWFVNSPTPGQIGPAIIEGHVDSPSGPSVFFRLGQIKPGNKIHVHRIDGVDLIFTVQAIRDFPKSRFPTRLVYGSGTGTPELRLITCSDFNTTTHHHEGNEVVFARLTHRSR